MVQKSDSVSFMMYTRGVILKNKTKNILNWKIGFDLKDGCCVNIFIESSFMEEMHSPDL